MTKSANRANRELTDYVLRAMREVPDGETIDLVDADNILEPMTIYGGHVDSIEHGIMEVQIMTLHARGGVMIRRTYQMLAQGLRLVSEEPELT